MIDAVMFAGLQDETGAQARLSELEQLMQLFLAVPIPEVRERILRKFYQKLRVGTGIGAQADALRQAPRASKNVLYVAKFLLRKGILNHLVNGILINRDIAQAEESQLQMSIG